VGEMGAASLGAGRGEQGWPEVAQSGGVTWTSRVARGSS
jgi:hypothetical protein